MKQLALTVCIALLLGYRGWAQTPTWSEHIAPIVYKHCTSCHRPGEIAPFPLTNYQEAAAWGNMMKYVTEIRYMPPWKADPDYGVDYLKENYLTESQISDIRAWVDGGMPEGDPALAPPLPFFPSGSQVGTPDLVLSFAQTHVHPGNGIDEYRYFVLPTGLTQPRNLVALEMRPGNKSIVHHALLWADSTGAAAALDAQTPEYGYLGGQAGGMANVLAMGTQLPGYVPGVQPHLYSHGIAQRIPANSDLVVQVHYAPTATDEPDSSTFNLFFTDQPVNRYVQSKIMVPFFGTLLNGPFIIPANQTRAFHGVWQVPQTISMLGIAPHMHLLGTHWEVFAVKPSGDTVNLIRINEWDFNWQGGFYFKNLIRLPQGTRIHAIAGYDNTVNNPFNPNNPPQNVSWGEGTSDEMYYLPLLYVPYSPGDENLDLEEVLTQTEDSGLHFIKTRLYPVAPNPIQQADVKIGFTLERGMPVQLEIFDIMGRSVASPLKTAQAFPGEHVISWNTAGLQNGVYLITLNAGGEKQTQKVLIQR
jgi:hypothetical protein